MSTDNIYKQEFNVRDLATTSVTFFPAKANVVRDIKDVVLKPGTNEVVINGITPTADENSIKVDGKGSATITDMVVEMIPNSDRYEDVYPSDTDSEDESSSDDSSSEDEDDTLQKIVTGQKVIDGEIKQAQETKASASARLTILESYGRSVDKGRPSDITEFLGSYGNERRKAFETFDRSENDLAELAAKRQKLVERRLKHLRQKDKSNAKASKSQAKAKKRQEREKEKKRIAQRQTKVNRINFWPKKVYRVVVSIDSLLDLTPGSSRRGSISSMTKTIPESEACNINLSISYITSCASWAPRYDLSLHSPSHSGTILYRAEFRNTTSEVWKDAKVVLSTSTSAFQGLGEIIPQMQPWTLDLTKNSHDRGAGSGALLSFQEKTFGTIHHQGHPQKPDPPRDSLFGLDNLDQQSRQMLLESQAQHHQKLLRHQNILSNNKPVAQQAMQQQAMPQQAVRAMPPPAPGGLFGNSANNGNVMQSASFGGGGSPAGFGAPLSGTVFASRAAAPRRRAAASPGSSPEGLAFNIDADEATMIPDMPPLDTQETSWSESGLTVNYDINGLRTIPPSFNFRRQRLATVNLKDIQLHHLLVPKLRAAAFLKARIRNNSSTSLLRGTVGVTLDGSFLGNTTLPRCSAGETLNLNLGADPSVIVKYPKPEVRKSQSGILNKESSSIYTRTCTITNTKANGSIEGLLLDQVPVSSDERLRVDILRPRGLRHEGDAVASGTGLPLAGKEDLKWGKAKATLKKSGEVCFDFKIEGGKGARFAVEYETRHSSTDWVVSN